MKFVLPKVTLVENSNLQDKIERCYRICYQSEDKMKEGSDAFLKSILNRPGMKHYSPLEHARVCFSMNGLFASAIDAWQARKGTRFIAIDWFHELPSKQKIIMVTANFRSLREFLDDFTNDFELTDNEMVDRAQVQYCMAKELSKLYPAIFSPVTLKKGIIPDDESIWHPNFSYLGEAQDYATFRIVTSRDVLQQLARHRSSSFSVESTKFINYTKRSFEAIIPYPFPWTMQEDWTMINQYHPNSISFATAKGEIFVKHMHACEECYRKMVEAGASAQEARMVLPGDFKTELYMTATYDAWKHFLALRNDDHAAPMTHLIAGEIAENLEEALKPKPVEESTDENVEGK